MKRKFVRIALLARSRDDEQLMCIACGNFLHAGKHVEFAVDVHDGVPQVGIHRACMPAVHSKRDARAARTTDEVTP